MSIWILSVRLILALGLVTTAHLLPIPSSSRLWAEVMNAGHVVVMGLFALIMLGVSLQVFAGHFRTRWHYYATAFLVTVTVGGLLELAQIPGPRDADIMDVLRDAIGAFCFLSIYFTWDRSLSQLWLGRGRIARPVIVGAAVVVLLLSWSPAILWGGAFYHRDSLFPTLCTFDSRWEPVLWTTANATLTTGPPPAGWVDARGGQVGRMVCRPSRRAGFAINEAYPDWSAYRTLQLDVYLDLDSTTAFVVQVEDRAFRGINADWFTYVSPIEPGLNTVVVPLEESASLPSGQPLDLTRVRRAYFYTMDTTRQITLYMDNIALR